MTTIVDHQAWKMTTLVTTAVVTRKTNRFCSSRVVYQLLSNVFIGSAMQWHSGDWEQGRHHVVCCSWINVLALYLIYRSANALPVPWLQVHTAEVVVVHHHKLSSKRFVICGQISKTALNIVWTVSKVGQSIFSIWPSIDYETRKKPYKIWISIVPSTSLNGSAMN